MSSVNSKRHISPEAAMNGAFKLFWDYDECTDRTASAFSRLARKVEKSGAKRIVLDMSKCRFLSVGGLRRLLEWYSYLQSQGIQARVSGLSPLLANVLNLVKLDWLIVNSE